MSTTRKLWLGLAVLLTASFATLLWIGSVIHQQAPPLPAAVVTSDGQTLYTRADMEEGRQVWQSIGGQQLGSIWGHGALIAPDWSADWLHREAVAWVDLIARRQHGLLAACLVQLAANSANLRGAPAADRNAALGDHLWIVVQN